MWVGQWQRVRPHELLEKLGGRCEVVHMKDVIRESWTPGDHTIPGQPVEIGTGDIDLQECMLAARQNSVEWLIYEHNITEDPVASF